MSVVTVGVGELAELIWDHRTLVQSPASPFTICTTSDKPMSEKWRWREAVLRDGWRNASEGSPTLGERHTGQACYCIGDF